MKATRPKPERFEPGISREVVSSIAAALLTLGFDARADLPSLDLGSDAVIPGAIADRLLDTAATRLGKDALGIELASRMPIGALGLLDYVLSTSATLGDALRRVSQHYGLATGRVTLRLVEAAPSAALVFQRSPLFAHSRHWLEFSTALFATRIRQTLAQDVKFESVMLVREEPKSRKAYDDFFGTKVVFGAQEERVGFAYSLLLRPLRTASTALAELLDMKIRELEPKQNHDAFIDRVRLQILDLLDQRDIQLDSLATRLHMTRRTLQRELGRRETSHKEMLDEIRRERASALLAEALTVTEVAERLAYSEPSAFFRAYRRWTGTSPRARQ